MKSYQEFLESLKTTNPNFYNSIVYKRAKSQNPHSEIIKYIDSEGNPQTSTQSIGMSNSDPVGSLLVEGAVLNPAFKILGKGVSSIIRNTPKFSYNISNNIPGIKSKKLAERIINSTGIKANPNFSYSDIILKKTKGRPAYYSGEIKTNSTQQAHINNIKKKLSRLGESRDIEVAPSKVWVAADNSFGNSSGWFSNIGKGNILLRKGESPSTILNTQVHESISHGTDDIIESMANKRALDYYKSFGDIIQQSNKNIKYKNSPKWYEIRATMNELLHSLANKYRKTKNIDIYKNIKQIFKDTSDEELMELVKTTNGYGIDYYNAYLNNPEIANKIKYMLQALPTGTGLIMNSKNE